MFKLSQRTLLILIMIVAISTAFWTGAEWNKLQTESSSSSVNSAESSSVDVDSVDLSAFWKSWQIINERFVDTTSTSTSSSTSGISGSNKKVTDQDKVWGAIDGLVASLGDPYSDFMPPEDNKVFNEDIQGEFGGIGIEIGARDGALTVISPLEGSPAKRAGLKAGDKIIKVAGTEVSGLTINEATNLIRGKVGTAVTLAIARAGEKENLEVKIIREVIKVPTLETKLLPDDIFLIKLFNFGATSADLFRKALVEFVNSGTDKLMIDLRGNPGGYLDTAVDISSWFLLSGSVVVKEDHEGRAENKIFKSRGYDVFSEKLKLVILVDGGSASASEILAGALSEHGVARLVGEKTFGKGSVQELIPITDDTSLKLTIARWLTPAGHSISHQGITPDIVVKLVNNKEEKKTETEKDLILEAGVKALLNWTKPVKKI